MKLRDMHLSSLDIGSMNHSRAFIRKFVESMSTVMDRKIGCHVKAVDPITRRKRVFSFMADKVTELHKTGDVVVLLLMSEEGVQQYIFVDYLLVTRHTGEALMNQIYKDNFLTKLGLTPGEIMAQCTGAAVDGQYFSMVCTEAIAKRMIEGAKGGPATTTEVQNRKEWMLCTWDPAHRLELVTGDIRVDKLGVDVELMTVPWYAQTPKDISAMYA
jgi:hypothetical protein